ncbi:MAG: hypothetical protein GY754_41295, partial [bacterium]|nr:hypothetical protein [bacterium]
TDNLYCTGSSPTSISVDAAPAGFEINWYAAASGGASLFTGETYTPASAGTYYAEVEEIISGCTSTNRVAAILTEESNPTVLIANGASEDICAGASVDLVATGAISYSWSPTTDLSCTDCPNPVASPSGFTTYTVTGTNLAGCTNTASIGVTVHANPTTSITADQDVCNGNSISLSATGGSTYSWTPAIGLSCADCDAPTASPTNTTVYSVEITDAAGCSATESVTLTV